MSKKSRAKAKKDTGIAVLKNGYRISEETRDALQKHDWRGPRNIRSDLTTDECKRQNFSGFRANVFGNQMELWLLGEVKETANLLTCTPKVMADMHERVFATIGTLIDVPDLGH